MTLTSSEVLASVLQWKDPPLCFLLLGKILIFYQLSTSLPNISKTCNFTPIKNSFHTFESNLITDNSIEFCQWPGKLQFTHLPILTAFHSVFLLMFSLLRKTPYSYRHILENILLSFDLPHHQEVTEDFVTSMPFSFTLSILPLRLFSFNPLISASQVIFNIHLYSYPDNSETGHSRLVLPFIIDFLIKLNIPQLLIFQMFLKVM